MFAIIAFICFLLALLDINLGDLTVQKLVYLGLMFIALQLAIGGWPLSSLKFGRGNA